MSNRDAKALALAGMHEILAGERGMSMDEALPALTAFLSEVAAPGFACAMVPLPPTPAVAYPGVGGVAEAWRDWGATFESVHAELDEVLESDDHLVMLVKQIAVTRHGGVEVTQPSALVWQFNGGRVVRLEFHLDRDEALRVAGL